MTNMTAKQKEQKVREVKCQRCFTLKNHMDVFVVRDVKMCLACGKKEIAAWNQAVQESEAKNARTA